MICREENFYKPLETDNIVEKVIKPDVTEHIAEVVPSLEIPAQNEVENYNVEAASIETMNVIINKHASIDMEFHMINAKVLN